MSLSDTRTKVGGEIYSYYEREVKEAVKKLLKEANGEGGWNCNCYPGEMIEGGKGITCDFCKGLMRVFGDKIFNYDKE